VLPFELDSVEEAPVTAGTVCVAAGVVRVAAGAPDFGAVAPPREPFEELLGAAMAGAGAVEIVGVPAGVVAAGVLGVFGAAVVGVSAGGAKTAALAVPGRARASVVSRHKADLDTDAWVIEIERIGL
jgi:hypothetical protein